MTNDATFDFLVIGGGIAGASAACVLASHGSVVLVERERQCGYHATGRSAALLTEAWETPLIRRITRAGRSFLEAPSEGFSDVPLVKPRSILLVGRSDQRDSIDAAAAEVRAEIPSVRLIDGTEAVELCPVLDASYVDRGVLEPDGRTIDVDALLQGFLRCLRRRRGKMLTGAPVTTIERLRAGWSVAAGDRRLEAGMIVNAAGAWADRVATMAGIEPVGLQPYRRTAFTFAPPDGFDVREWPAVIDIDEQFYFEPEGVQLLGSPAEQTPKEPHDVRHDETDVAIAVERIEAASTLRIRSVRRAWAGLRTFAPDRNPVVGPDPAAPGFVWLAGQGGFGIMTSPALAAIVASMITEGRIPPGMAAAGISEDALRPERLR